MELPKGIMFKEGTYLRRTAKEIRYVSKHYVATVAIGKDHFAELIIEEQALKALQEQAEQEGKALEVEQVPTRSGLKCGLCGWITFNSIATKGRCQYCRESLARAISVEVPCNYSNVIKKEGINELERNS